LIRLSHRSALLWFAEHLRLGSWDLFKAWSGAADEQDLRMIELTDYPKLHCPFVRKTYEVNNGDWR
jgi:hypothetical protein